MILEEHAGEAGTQNRRFVVALRDGARVEAVLYREDTLCVSTQVGCAVGCPFCASGASGLARPLSLDELIAGVEAVRARGIALSGVTASGVGEPLHNAAVPAFLEWCAKERLRMSLTTSGGPLARLAEWLGRPHQGLTISVHAGTEPTRASMVPRGPALEPLFALLRERVPALTRHRRKKTALAYLLVQGRNDGDAELDAFAERARDLGLSVHLYAYNPVPTSDARPVSRARYQAAFERLRARGLTLRMSSRARLEANGGCGTLIAVPKSIRKSNLQSR